MEWSKRSERNEACAQKKMMKKNSGSDQKKQGLGRSARLRSKKSIDTLFRTGKVIHRKFLRLHYLSCDSISEDQAMMVVGKKYFRKAVRRNKVRRRIKEAYRLERAGSSGRQAPFYHFAFVYHFQRENQALPTYAELARDVEEALKMVSAQ